MHLRRRRGVQVGRTEGFFLLNGINTFCGAPRPAGVAPLHRVVGARERGGEIQRLSRALGGLAEALRGDRAPIRVHVLDTSRGVAETNPVVRTVTTQ